MRMWFFLAVLRLTIPANAAPVLISFRAGLPDHFAPALHVPAHEAGEAFRRPPSTTTSASQRISVFRSGSVMWFIGIG